MNGLSRQEHEDPVTAAGAPPDPTARFAAGVAHDFNNLLTVINGYGELALTAQGVPSFVRTCLIEMLGASAKAAEIVKLILAYTGQQMLAFEDIDVNRVIGSMHAFMRRYLGESISLELRLCRDACPVRADSAQLQWALAILLANAKDAMPAGGRLEIYTRRVPEGGPPPEGFRGRMPCLELGVRDSGRGIGKAHLSRIFDPYFSTKRRGNVQGMGMGLACAQGIARQLGGCIVADSEPGRGSTFRICLPIVVGDPEAACRPQPPLAVG